MSWLNLNTRNDILLYFRHMYLTLRKTSELLKPIVVALQINCGVVLINRVSVVATNSTGCDQLQFDSLLPASKDNELFRLASQIMFRYAVVSNHKNNNQ